MVLQKDFEFSESLGKDRYIDRIVFVTDDLKQTKHEFEETFGYNGFIVQKSSCGETASVRLESGIELFIVRPGEKKSVYRSYMEEYGKGIMGVRERITLAKATLWKYRNDKLGIQPIIDDKYCCWLDLRKDLGCFHGLHICEDPVEPKKYHKHIGQICIVTDNTEKAAADMLHYIGKGPWEIGFINNHTSEYFISSEYDAGSFPEGEMRVGMGWFSNLEFELIEPTKGPMPYFRFLKRHGNGYHHIKETVPSERWDDMLKHYADKGIGTALAGKVGPCAFCNLDTEEMLGCVYELGDDHVMEQLPEGYDPYLFPVDIC